MPLKKATISPDVQLLKKFHFMEKIMKTFKGYYKYMFMLYTNLYGMPLIRTTPLYFISECPDIPGIPVVTMLLEAVGLKDLRPTIRSAP